MRHTLVAIALFFAVTAPAADLKDSLSSGTIYWENDNFGQGRKSDRFYTNGVRVDVQLADAVIQNWLWTTKLRNKAWQRLHPGRNGEQPVAVVSFVFGQNFYTPQTITIAAPQPLDRPWAGVLYGGISEGITNADRTVQDLVELTVGVLGPGAGAQATQKFVHNDLGFSNNDPMGWHNQLRNEPTLAFRYQQMRRLTWPVTNNMFDFVPAYGGQVGSPQTYLNGGGLLRLGYHISGLPTGLIPGAAAGEAPFKYEVYVFAGGEGRWVPFNATLDGGLFHDGPKANGPKRFVTDARAGLSVRIFWLRLTYSTITRSAEFQVPPGYIKSQRFGSYALTFEPFNSFR